MKAYRAGGGGSCPGCSPGPPFKGAPLNAPLLPTPASSASKRAISAARSAIAAAPVLLQGRQGKAEAGKEWLRWCGSQWGERCKLVGSEGRGSSTGGLLQHYSYPISSEVCSVSIEVCPKQLPVFTAR